MAALVLLVWLCTPARAAESPAKADDVIFPRTAAAGGPATAGRAGGTSPLLLIVALGAAAAGGWLLWRQRRAPAGLNGRDGRRLSVVESRGLGNRQYLVVADYDGRKFLLGVCPGRIELLSPLGEGRGEEKR
jgi:flagellar protein FliO/FliZ